MLQWDEKSQSFKFWDRIRRKIKNKNKIIEINIFVFTLFKKNIQNEKSEQAIFYSQL